MKPQPTIKSYSMGGLALYDCGKHGARFLDSVTCRAADRYPFCPYGVPGDRLWVKESAWMWCERVPNGTTKTGRPKWRYVPLREAPIQYAADHPKKPATSVVSPDTGNEWGWRFKIGRFLPRWASRIDLELSGVRVERLQDISTWDAAAEGVNPFENPVDCQADGETANQAGFRLLWESINGAGSWDANPFVWVILFKHVKL